MNIEFIKFIRKYQEIIKHPHYLKQKEYIQHGNVSVFRHSISVAFLCYKMAKRKKKYDVESLTKASLLHDYFLYDWHIRGSRKGLHGFTHPKAASINAENDFKINDFEKNIITSHMWPLNIFTFPKTKEAWMLIRMDRKQAIIEMFRKKKKVHALNKA